MLLIIDAYPFGPNLRAHQKSTGEKGDIRSNRISKEIYRQSTAGFSQTPRGLCLRLEALIQLTLSNLDSKKQDQKVQGSHSQRKHRMAFTVLLRQYRLTGFSCSALFARRPRRSVCLHLDSVKSLRVKHTTICSKSTYTIRLEGTNEI